ncbi:PEP-CTERM sorting domain-containing protein [Pacificimonas flava]|uniref:Ice-binding protein C-terminal domain-containing protein n=1 Tax=Pacificimonas flava TaxID=1234595 RepID=M2U4M8_9SPHN|nr:PEP-CTERM sorting domain-containing protein [Pacificimonas flava]EMD82987.1 hypothetical protein C725_1585 [Pacificimonas flava]MBB5280147.1 hypothetical protein [Pacificimonas flava]
MFSFKGVVAAAILAGAATGVSAAVVSIDDFSTYPYSTTLDSVGSTASDTATLTPAIERTIFFERLANGGTTSASANAEVSIADGILELANDSNVNSRLTLTYSLDGLFDTGGVTGFDIFVSNSGTAGDGTIQALLNGTSLGTVTLPNGMEGPISFSFSDALAAGNPDELTFIFSGSPSYDMLIGPITANVPEPGALGLLGLGVLGMAAAMKRRRAVA